MCMAMYRSEGAGKVLGMLGIFVAVVHIAYTWQRKPIVYNPF